VFEELGYNIVEYHAHEGYMSPTYVSMEKRLLK
jgi:hypothetical protein